MRRGYVISGFALVAAAALISNAIAGSGGSAQDRGRSATSRTAALVFKASGKRGKRGKRGRRGLPGPQGPPGSAGAETAVWIHQLNPTPADCTTPVCNFVAMSGTIGAAGPYLMTAKIRLENLDSTISSNRYTCSLERTPPTTVIDTTTTKTVPYSDGDVVPLQGAATFAAGDSVQISCSNPPGDAGETVATQGSIIATPFAYAEQALP